jgi:hypothetical protein
MTNYKIIDPLDGNSKENWHIRIVGGKYDGVILKFDQVSIDNSSEPIKIHIQYTIIDDNGLTIDKENFKKIAISVYKKIMKEEYARKVNTKKSII